MVDWANFYDTLYSKLSVAAVLTIAGTDGDDYEVRVINKTKEMSVGDGVQVATVTAAYDMRASAFFGYDLVRGQLEDASITVNGNTFDVEYHEMRTAPIGEAAGEIRLFLSEQDD